MKKLSDIRLIDQYIQGSLSLTQLRLLEKRLNSDPDFMNLYQDMLVFIEGVKESAKTRTEAEKWAVLRNNKKTLLSAGGENESQLDSNIKGFRRFRLTRWAGVAAIALLLIVATWVLWPATDNPYALALENSELSVPKHWYGQRGTGDVISLSQIANDFENEKYSNVIVALEDRLSVGEKSTESNIEEQLFLAFSYLKSDKTAKAILLLEELRSNAPDTRWSDTADWYLALAYWKNGEEERANLLIKDISKDPTHSFRENARNLTSFSF